MLTVSLDDIIIYYFSLNNSMLAVSLDDIIFYYFSLNSSMLAVSLDDFRIMIIDVDTRKIVRTFNGHQNVITDLVRIYIYINTMLE